MRSVNTDRHRNGAKRLECAELALHLIRIAGTADPPWALSVNPARGGLFIAPGPYYDSQTPLGVTCEASPWFGHRKGVNRSPLTGFGKGIARSGHYKQATPSGVLGQHTQECKDVCKGQELAPAVGSPGAIESGSKLRALQTLREVQRVGSSAPPHRVGQHAVTAAATYSQHTLIRPGMWPCLSVSICVHLCSSVVGLSCQGQSPSLCIWKTLPGLK